MFTAITCFRTAGISTTVCSYGFFFSFRADAEGTAIKAPLPGNVLSISVQEGEAVKSGQVLMLIEAMKMENEVLAPADGVVRKIAVEKGAMVATGDTLIII